MNRRKFMAGVATTGAVATAGCMGLGNPRGQSQYTGFVVDLQYQSGLIFKNTIAHVKTDPKSGTSERFNIAIPQDQELYEQLQEAQQDGRKVTVHYKRSFWESPFTSFGSYSVMTDVDLHDETLDEE